MSFYIERYKNRERIEYEVEVVTPMFLGGADGKSAELRTASIKGMLRFWWRALYGGDDIKKMKRDESKCFGSANEKYGKSRCILNLFNVNNLKTGKYRVLLHSEKKKFQKNCICENQEFSIKITKEFGELLEICCYLGGLGNRSRRGFGSIGVLKKNKNEYLMNKENLLRLLKLFDNSFNSDNEIFTINRNTSDRKLNYPYIKKIYFGEYSSNYDDLLKIIGVSSHKNNSNYTGYAYGRDRNASPVYVSIIKLNNEHFPIITTLNNSMPERFNNREDKSEQFVTDILKRGGK